MTVSVGDEIWWWGHRDNLGQSYLKIHKIENGTVHAVGWDTGGDVYQTSSIEDWEKFANKDGVIKR